MISALIRAGLTALLVIALVEGAARVGIARVAAHCYDVLRIPNLDRFWPQYTAFHPEKRRDERLVILITNSQGHVRSDGGVWGYPARLQALLNQHDPDQSYVVANWAIGGGRGAEMVVLAAQAAAHQPDLVMLVSYSRNFADRRAARPLSTSDKDIQHLAYLPEVRRHLSPWFLEEFQVWSPRARLAAYSRLVQLHEAFVSVVKGRTVRSRPSVTVAKSWTDFGVRLLDEFYRTLRRGLPETPLLVVSMPVNLQRFTEESELPLRAFAPRATARFGHDSGVTIVDAIDLITPDRFGDDTHFGEEEHDVFARWLLPRVLTAMGPGGA